MEAVGPSWLMETMIMVSVRISSEPMGVSLPSSRMLVVLSGTSKVGTAVGTAVEGVGMPSSSSSGAEMVSTGLTWGRLVGVAVGTAVLVGVVVLAGVVVGVGLGPGVWVPTAVGVADGLGVSLAIGVAASSLSAIATSTVAAKVGKGAASLPAQLAKKRVVVVKKSATPTSKNLFEKATEKDCVNGVANNRIDINFARFFELKNISLNAQFCFQSNQIL